MNVVVKLPNDIGERVLAFPFLHILNQYMEERLLKIKESGDSKDAEDKFQIHLICYDKGIEILNLLPFHAYYHELKEEDLISVFSVHRGCADFKLPKEIDIFISTTDSLVDASIGKNLKAKEKIGFNSTLNNWFLTKKIQKAVTKHRSEQISDLVKPLTGYISKIPVCLSRTLEKPSEDEEKKPYILLDLDLIEDKINPVWRDLFELASGAHFILSLSREDEFTQELRISTFLKSLPKKNTYEFLKFPNFLEYSKFITFSQAFATTRADLTLLSSYCGKQTVFFNKEYNFNNSGSQFLRGEVTNALITDYNDSDGFSKGFDLLLECIDSIKQKSKESDSKPL